VGAERVQHLSPALIGLIAAVASVGALIVAVSASRLAARFGPGRTMVASLLLCSPASFVIPFVERDWTLLLLTVSQGLHAACVVTYNITQVSLRQALCPPKLVDERHCAIRRPGPDTDRSRASAPCSAPGSGCVPRC
jgi:MFS family permease